jgi:LacI family transcriptional regulator
MGTTKRSIGVYGPNWEDTFQRCVGGILRYCDQVGGLIVRDFQNSEMIEDYSRPPIWARRVDAMVVSMGREIPTHELVDWLMTAGAPTVTVVTDWFDPRVPACIIDWDSMGKLAARHLIQCGCRSFLYVGFVDSTGSGHRGRALRNALVASGQTLTEYESPVRLTAAFPEQLPKFAEPNLVKLLHRLPKPLGVWALSDNYAGAVNLVCEEQGLAVPQAVKILGVGDTRAARMSRPTISSIHTPNDQVGFQAARTLHAMLDKRPGVRKVTQVRATELVQRESTLAAQRGKGDLDEVRDYINRHACSGVSVDQLVDIVGVSRRTFENWFLKEVGRMPGEEIRRVRMERAMHLLRGTELSISQIALMIGYEETAAFSKAFRNATGTAPSDYRQGGQAKPVRKRG